MICFKSGWKLEDVMNISWCNVGSAAAAALTKLAMIHNKSQTRIGCLSKVPWQQMVVNTIDTCASLFRVFCTGSSYFTVSIIPSVLLFKAINRNTFYKTASESPSYKSLQEVHMLSWILLFRHQNVSVSYKNMYANYILLQSCRHITLKNQLLYLSYQRQV